ncbi:MAG: hypothetical protein A2033_16290 [Bacteroidetes bacterium GWA2_31_9]|nr:MAG: hypothetical protein A2033_16290 [Bacteroidetes bacterium GWA2_31_9]
MKRLIQIFVFFLFLNVANSQNVAITDDDTYVANTSSMLDVKSTTKGLLVPRLTTAQRTAVATPATSLLVFDTSLNGFYYYNGTAWVNLSSGSSSGLLWSYNSPYIYTTTTSDYVGIGTSTPLHKLHVSDNVTITDGTDGSYIDLQNSNTSTGAMTGFRFLTGTSTSRFKGGIFYKNSGTWGRGDLILANNSTAAAGNVTSTDARLTIKNTGGIEVKGTTGASASSSLFHVLNASGDTIFAVYDGGVRINVYDDTLAKANTSKGGFAVGGFSPSKGTFTNDYLRITPDSIRMYIEEGAVNKATTSKGGFAVGGFSPSKAVPSDYFNIYGATATTTINPSEARIFWYPLKEAFLAGRVLVESPDSVGTNSFSTGYESKAIGDYSQAFGYQARAFGNNSTAIGNYANAKAASTFAMGDGAIASGIGSYAFGSLDRDTLGATTNAPTMATGNYSFAIGLGAKASNVGAYSIGTTNTASGKNSTAIGIDNTTSGTYSTAIGNSNTATGTNSVAIGRSSTVSGSDNIVLGWSNSASSYFQAVAGAINPQSVAIGTSCAASYSTTGTFPLISNVASGQSIAIGRSCIAKSQRRSVGMTSYEASAAVAIGRNATAEGKDVFAIGADNAASGEYSMSFGHGINVTGDYSMGFALSDQSSTTVATSNTMAIMGGKVGIGYVSPLAELHVQGSAYVYNNLGISTVDFGNGSKTISIEVGTTPTASATNSVLLYASGINAELRVRDESGNITTLSPHNFNFIKKSEPMAWSYYSENPNIGQIINVDMLKTIRLVESLTGEKLVHISDLNNNEIESEKIDKESLLNKIEKQQELIDELIRRIEEIENK